MKGELSGKDIPLAGNKYMLQTPPPTHTHTHTHTHTKAAYACEGDAAGDRLTDREDSGPCSRERGRGTGTP